MKDYVYECVQIGKLDKNEIGNKTDYTQEAKFYMAQ